MLKIITTLLLLMASGAVFSDTCKSIFQKDHREVRFSINNANYQSESSRLFLDALESEKEVLMRLYKLDNDLYNKLSCFAFGVLGSEAYFAKTFSEEFYQAINLDDYRGQGNAFTTTLTSKLKKIILTLKYRTKEEFPYGVAITKHFFRRILKPAKKIYLDHVLAFGELEATKKATSFFLKKMLELEWKILNKKISIAYNSKGPTQIKVVPKVIKQEYGFTKKDLKDPYVSGVATLGYLAQSIKQLDNYGISREQYLNYLQYIYLGSIREIRRGTATPDKNLYLQRVRVFMSALEIEEN